MEIKKSVVAGVSGTVAVLALSVAPASAAECVDNSTYPPSVVECATEGAGGEVAAATGAATMPSTGASTGLPVLLGLGALGLGGGLMAVARSRRSEV